jgi:lipoprotein-releasing system ATP-binding protein
LILQKRFDMNNTFNDKMNRSESILQVENINKTYLTYGTKTEVLKNVSFNIHKGEMLAISGPSGAGKSTLLHILGTLDKPTSGQVLHNGKNLSILDNKKLADFRNRKLGFIFQFHHLLPEFNALENTMMPALIAGVDKKHVREKAKKILSRMGLEKRFTHKPGELSGGEQQRVAVARALMMDPEIILADEPTGNLDSHTGLEVFGLLLELNQEMGMTLIIVTHNEEFSKRMPRRITLIDGKIIDS